MKGTVTAQQGAEIFAAVVKKLDMFDGSNGYDLQLGISLSKPLIGLRQEQVNEIIGAFRAALISLDMNEAVAFQLDVLPTNPLIPQFVKAVQQEVQDGQDKETEETP